MRKILMRKRFSKHPGDWFLEVVLCRWGGQYVTWVHNKQAGGYFWGHYFDYYSQAVADFHKRGASW